MCGAQKLREILSWHVAGHETRSLKHQGPSAQHLKEHPEVILNEHTPNPSPARLCDAAAPQKPAYAKLNSIKPMLYVKPHVCDPQGHKTGKKLPSTSRGAFLPKDPTFYVTKPPRAKCHTTKKKKKNH